MWRQSQLARAAQDEIDEKTKPVGSLGRLESLAVQVAAAQNRLQNLRADRARLLLFAADHGIAAEGISAYHQEVTIQMVSNILNGGAASCVLCKENGVDLQLIDVGVAGDTEAEIVDPTYGSFKIRQGTNNFRHDTAMTVEEARMALDVGSLMVARAADDGYDIICLGELGIGNTASAACLWSALCDLPAEITAGRGTGLTDSGLDHKREVLTECLSKHQEVISTKNAEEILAAVGGFEIAALVGAILEGCRRRRLVVIDGFTVTVACLVAMKMDNELNQECLIFSHVSEEKGHAALLESISAPQPLLNLNMRLGEGTGAALAVPLIRSAVAIFNSMATFGSAKISTAKSGSN